MRSKMPAVLESPHAPRYRLPPHHTSRFAHPTVSHIFAFASPHAHEHFTHLFTHRIYNPLDFIMCPLAIPPPPFKYFVFHISFIHLRRCFIISIYRSYSATIPVAYGSLSIFVAYISLKFLLSLFLLLLGLGFFLLFIFSYLLLCLLHSSYPVLSLSTCTDLFVTRTFAHLPLTHHRTHSIQHSHTTSLTRNTHLLHIGIHSFAV